MEFVNETDFYTVEPLWATGWSEEASALLPGDIAILHGAATTRRFQQEPHHAVILISTNMFLDYDSERERLRALSVSKFPSRAAVFRAVSEPFIQKRAGVMSLLAERARKRKLEDEEQQPEDMRYFAWKFAMNCYRWDLPKDSPYYVNLTADTITPQTLEDYLMRNPNFRLRGRIMGGATG